MASNQNNSNLGDQILKTIDEMLDSGNFDKLNSVVSDTVSKALEETRKQLEKVTSGKAVEKQGAKAMSEADSGSAYKAQTAAVSKVTFGRKNKIKRIGSVSGVLFKVFGGIGTGLFGFGFIFGAISSLANNAESWDTVTGVGVLLLFSLLLICLGVGKSARLKRAERYLQVMQGKTYINLTDLALLTNCKESYVRKDIKKMLRIGMFPEGHLDMQEKCLIIGDVAYREYIRLEKSRKVLQMEAEEQKRIEIQNASHAELNLLIQEGDRCILQLRDLNDAIEGEVISAKLFRLENLLKEIFEQLKEHPEQMSEMHRFMDYYLPTTLKLVTAYEEFDHISVPGEDILSAKTEIEKTLDTINMAFAELLNKLFRDRAFDAATDAQVLKTMLAQEGLTEEPIYAYRSNPEEPKSMQMQKEYK